MIAISSGLCARSVLESLVLSVPRLVILSGVVLTGCHTVERAAVTTFHVIDTPARMVRDRIDPPQTTTSTEYATSDVVTPGRPVEVTRTTPPPTNRITARAPTTASSPTSQVDRSASNSPEQPTPGPRAISRPSAAAQTNVFPTAKPVPGRSGYVYSIDPNGGIVDVTGYKSGDKAKDPYTKQIFIVP